MNVATSTSTGYTGTAQDARPFLWERIESNSSDMQPDEYEYTDEDAAKDTQPFYYVYEKVGQGKPEEKTVPEYTRIYNDADYKERYEAGLKERPIDYPEDYNALMRDAMNIIDEQRDDSSGLYLERSYSYGASPEEADWLFDELDENRTPEGWPETFYEY